MVCFSFFIESRLLIDVDFDKCMDWRPWSTAMGVSAAGGSWIIDFIVYFLFSVSALQHYLV